MIYDRTNGPFGHMPLLYLLFFCVKWISHSTVMLVRFHVSKSCTLIKPSDSSAAKALWAGQSQPELIATLSGMEGVLCNHLITKCLVGFLKG